ncbi:MAG: proline--tRNA ligase [Nanoarchaeota archaeon]
MEKPEAITVKKRDNFSEWYSQVIQKAELADYSKVSGCIVFRPRAYYIWETVQSYMNNVFKKLNIKNAYFPLLIPESLLKKEKEHVEGFNPEVAWVTQAGDTKLNERLAIRPTSETIMYDHYRKWIHSWKDLPLKLNQWNNIIRWEFQHPVPFLRTREFLWQEGHNAFATEKEVKQDTLLMLNIYEKTLKELYAIPALKGKKSEKEKFAGAFYTLSLETLLPNGKAIQCCTSHDLGQNFSRAFEINYLDKNEKKQYVWQNSWGFTTRTIGIMIALHGDDHGLVIPPKLAEIKVIIIPIIFEDSKKQVLKKANEVKKLLKNYNTYLDDREDYSAGWKFNEYELKGFPIRIEIGPKDIKKNQVILVRRDTLKKETVKIKNLNKKIEKTLEEIHNNLYNKAKKFLNEGIIKVKNINDMKKVIDSGKIAKIDWCLDLKCEDMIKEKTKGAKSLNISLTEKAHGKCFVCNNKANGVAYFAKSY